MTEDEHIKYIMTSEVGPLLCKGFAYLYREQPQFPIRKLGEWLLSQGRRKIDHLEISHRDSRKQQLATQLQKIESGQQKQRVRLVLAVGTWQQQKERFMGHINNMQYLQDLLEEWLPEFIEKEKGLAACYVGLLGNQTKIATDNDEDQNAHLDLQAPKIITYIGASKSSTPLMLGKILPPEKGISLQVFKVEDVPEGGDESSQGKKDSKQKYIYIPNVLKEEKIYYFRIPKLGSYAVFSMVVKNFLSDEFFDKNCEEFKKFISDKEQAEKNRNTELTNMKTELEEMEKKEEQGIKISEQYINLKTQYEALLNKPNEENNPVFQSVRKEYLLGCDTLGQDRQILQQTLHEIQEMVQLFVTHWQLIQQRNLIHDINLITSNPVGSENTEASDHALEEVQAQISSKTSGIKQRITDEKQVSYEVECARLKALKRVFLEKGVKSLSVYQQFFVPKFKNALQIIMLFAGYRKQDITLKGTNILDWRKIHHSLSTELVDKIINHSHEGVKGEVLGYARVSKLLQRLDKLDLEAILSYNLGLWMLVKITKMSLTLRVAERDLLLEKYETKKKDREAKQQESIRITEERDKALEVHKATLQPDQIESFNDVEWLATYDADHPLPVIPEEPEFTPYIDI